MAQIIKPKRGTTTPTTSDLASGEFAVDTDSQEIYINDSGTVKLIGSSFTQSDVTVSQDDVTQYNGQISPLYSNIQNVSVAFSDLADATVITTSDTFSSSDTALITAAVAEGRYLKSYTETDTLSDVTGRGATTTDTITVGGIDLGDTDRARFGNSNDLQIYHDGTHSYIDETGTNDLRIRAFDDLSLMNINNNNLSLRCNLDDGAEDVVLYYANSPRVTTTSAGITVDGELDVDTIDITPQTSAPAFNESKLWYDDNLKSLAYYTDITDVIHEIGQEEHVRVYNNSGSTISKGTPVYYSGNYTAGDQDVGTVAPSNATDTAKFNAIGLTAADITNNSYGYVVLSGIIRNIDTSGLTAGENFFTGLTDGAVQSTAPVYPNSPMCLGWCVISNATTGVVVVDTQAHTIPNFRVNGSQYVAGDVRIEGDLIVTGSTITTSTEDVNIGGQYTFLQQGDTIGESGTSFSGTGLDDGLLVGTYTGTTSSKTFYVRIDGTGTPDTFEWSLDNFSTTEATDIAITGSDQALADGISVRFAATTGHTSGDTWSGTATPSNIDTGIISNRNTGSGGDGLDYVGLFYDVSDSKWKAFDQLDTKPTANINTADSSFGLATFVADTFEGDLTGNVTGNVTGNASSATTLQTSRNITLTGDVTGSASFNGSANASITTTIPEQSLTLTNVTITGDLDVQGTTTTTNSQTISSDSPLQRLNTTPTTNPDTGLILEYDDSGTDKAAGLFRDVSDSGKFKFFEESQQSFTDSSTIDTSATGFALATVVADTFEGSLDADNLTNKPDPVVTVTLGGDLTGSGSATLTDLGNGTATLSNASIASSAQLTFTDLDLTGDLNVFGTTTTVNQATLSVTDSKIFLADNNNADTIDTAVVLNYNDGTDKTAGFFRDASDSGKFKFFSSYVASDSVPTAINTSDSAFALGTVVADTFEGDLTGDVTGSATSLANARNFSGSGKITLSTESFDGTGAVSFTTSVGTFNLADLSNVSTTSPTNDQALVYNDTSGQWEPQDQSGSGGQFTPTKLDAITTVNGQATYALTDGGSAYTPSSALALLVLVNGVIQEPLDSFSVSGTNIIFSPALATGDVVNYIIDLGKAVEVGSYTETDTLATVTARGASTTADITVGSIDINGEIVEQTDNATSVSGSTALDPANGTIQRKTLSGTTTFTDSLANGESVTLHLVAGSNSVTFPTTEWPDGTAPTPDTTNETVIQFWKINSTLYGALVGVFS